MAYELAKRTNIWASLREELATVPIEMQYDIDVLRGLPYLNAFIRVRLSRRFKETRHSHGTFLTGGLARPRSGELVL